MTEKLGAAIVVFNFTGQRTDRRLAWSTVNGSGYKAVRTPRAEMFFPVPLLEQLGESTNPSLSSSGTHAGQQRGAKSPSVIGPDKGPLPPASAVKWG